MAPLFLHRMLINFGLKSQRKEGKRQEGGKEKERREQMTENRRTPMSRNATQTPQPSSQVFPCVEPTCFSNPLDNSTIYTNLFVHCLSDTVYFPNHILCFFCLGRSSYLPSLSDKAPNLRLRNHLIMNQV